MDFQYDFLHLEHWIPRYKVHFMDCPLVKFFLKKRDHVDLWFTASGTSQSKSHKKPGQEAIFKDVPNE